MDSQHTTPNGEVLHFVAKRLLNYKRINYDLLVETIRVKFSRPDAEELLSAALIDTQAAYIQNEHLAVSSRELLMEISGGS